MKKTIAFFLSMTMVLSLAACGTNEADRSEQTDSTADNAEQADSASVDSGETEDTEDVEEAQQEKDTYELVSPRTITSNYVELTYDEADGWVLPEYYLFDEDSYTDISLTIPFEEGADIDRDQVPEQEGAGTYDQEISVAISVSLEDVSNFRYYLTMYDLDQQKYAEGGYDLINIGGADCVLSEGENWGIPVLNYLGRVENAGITISMEITGAENGDRRINKLLSGLTFKLEDAGNVDPPWSWEGQAFSGGSYSAKAGNVTLSSQWVPASKSILVESASMYAGAVVGENVYLPFGDLLKHYSYDGSFLAYVEDIKLDHSYEYIFADEKGTLWLSSYGVPALRIKDGAQTYYDDLEGVLAVSPSGTWGVLDAGSEYQKVTFSGEKVKTKSMAFDDIDWISSFLVDDDHIYASGDAVDGTGRKVFIYNKKGKLQKILSGEDGEGLGSIEFVAETDKGYIGLDAYYKEVLLWEKDGTYMGSASHKDLFGTNSPWLCGGSVLDDGSFLVYITDERVDGSAKEMIIYHLSV